MPCESFEEKKEMSPFPFRTVAVYCGSNPGKEAAFSQAAEQLAETFAEARLTLIYGGAKVGLMGKLASTLLKQGGQVIGVIPQALIKEEVAHEHLSELFCVKTMHERKALMAEKADAFILLPGGPGSWEEFFEMLTWAKLGYHQKPCGILNVHHYYDHLLQFLDHAVEMQFLHSEHRRMVHVDSCPRKLLQQFAGYQPPMVSAWM
jgi:uncharacterized protein (TIGR00730 family)